jgi:branched-chain amino acid transport system substrate-binding protein
MRRFLRHCSIFGIILGLVLGLSVTEQAVAEDTIKMGIIYAMTGKGSALGTKQMDSAKLAVKEINDRGGANFGGKRVKIDAIYQDTETKPDVAVRKMKSMIKSNNITALVGGTFAHVSLAMNAQSKRTPIIFCATNGVPEKMFTPKVKGPYSMSMIPPAESIGSGASAYVTEVMKLKNIVLLLPDYAYGHGALRGHENVLKKMPGVKYTTIMTPVGTADMTPYLIRAMEAKPEIVIMGQWGNDAINILKQAYEMGMLKKTKLFFQWIVNVFATGIPPEALEGVMCQMFWYHDMSGFPFPEVTQPANAFTAFYRSVYGEPPDPYGTSAYMGVHNAVRAMELAQSTDPKKAYEALMANPEWNGPKGPAKWMIDGNPRYKHASFMAVGLGPDKRKDMKWDYVSVIDSYRGKYFQKTPAELGW